jgi:hypothetical protein
VPTTDRTDCPSRCPRPRPRPRAPRGSGHRHPPFGILLPHIPDGDKWTASEYLASVARVVASQAKWEVETEAVGLGFFAFSKLLMWRDLDPDLWPNNGLLANGLIRALLGTDTPVEGVPPVVGDDEPIDEKIDLARAIHVADAGSSQAVVVAEAEAGRNLVVQGPPCTGKSQTITNIIAGRRRRSPMSTGLSRWLARRSPRPESRTSTHPCAAPGSAP